ncbi:PTS sugar transporter subunit IIC [candidate division KSB1 bacterium]
MELFIVAFVGGLLALDHTAAWQTMISQPLVACPLVGLLVGDPYSGLFVGALLQLLWLAEMPLGSSYYPDLTSGAVAGALVASLGRGRYDLPALSAFSLAVLAAVVFSWIGAMVEVKWIRRINGALSDRAMGAAERDGSAGLTRLTLTALAVVFLKGILIAVLAWFSTVALLRWWSLPDGGMIPGGGTILLLVVVLILVLNYFKFLLDRRNWSGVLLGLAVGLFLLRIF